MEHGVADSPEAYAPKVADVRAACDAEGRDPATFGLSVGLYSLMGEDEAAARAAFERGRAAAPGNAVAADDYESWRADTLSGTPEQVLERVAAFESLGVREISWPRGCCRSRSTNPSRSNCSPSS